MRRPEVILLIGQILRIHDLQLPLKFFAYAFHSYFHSHHSLLMRSDKDKRALSCFIYGGRPMPTKFFFVIRALCEFTS